MGVLNVAVDGLLTSPYHSGVGLLPNRAKGQIRKSQLSLFGHRTPQPKFGNTVLPKMEITETRISVTGRMVGATLVLLKKAILKLPNLEILKQTRPKAGCRCPQFGNFQIWEFLFAKFGNPLRVHSPKGGEY